ncbi:hypothetical protein B0H19DRAFT_943943, partial [Mycena capillaripes]
NNIPFANAVANVAFKEDKVVTFGYSFVNPCKYSLAMIPTTPVVPTTLEYLVNADNATSLIHVVQVRNQQQGTWYETPIPANLFPRSTFQPLATNRLTGSLGTSGLPRSFLSPKTN